MFSDGYLYKITDGLYRPRKKKFLPRVIQDDTRLNSPEYFYEKAVRNVNKNQIADTPQNREWCFWNEGMAQAFSYIICNSITGNGIRVKSNNEDAVKCIHGWNDRINNFDQTIEDAVSDYFIDNVIHGYGSWRILLNKDLKYKVDLSRMNPKRLVPVSHSRQGWTKFIQFAPIDSTEPNNKNQYMKKYNPAIDNESGTYNYVSHEWQRAHIPIEATVTISLFKKPPIVPAMNMIIFKKWIILFMKKAAEKFWSPTIWAKMGTEEHFPLDEDLYEERMNDLSKSLANWAIFKSIVTPFDVDIKQIEMKNSGMDYVGFIQYFDEQIVQYLLGSTGLTQSKGKDLATSRTNSEVFVRTIQAFRHKIGRALKKFYNEVLLPVNGIEAQEDLEIDWSHLKEGSDIEYVSMLVEALKVGVFKNFDEITKAARAVWPWIEGNKGDEPPKYLKKLNEMGVQNLGSKQMGNVDLSDRNRPADKAGPKGDKAAEAR